MATRPLVNWLPLADNDFRDIQGLVRFGHGHLQAARFHLLRIEDADAARRWLARAPVATAVKGSRPEKALQVAFTYPGLERLCHDEALLAQFPYEFISGMTEPSRARRLGDVGANSCEYWDWGGDHHQVDVLIMTYALDLAALDGWEQTIRDQDWQTGFAMLACLETRDIGDTEPFGFDDGISQPELDWERNRSVRITNTTAYTNQTALGEFLLGYPNEYGKYTDRPLLEPGSDPKNILPAAEDAPHKKDLGRNGTYLVLRDLAQDGPAFWQFVAEHAAAGGEDPDLVGAAMVGRVPSSLQIPRDNPAGPAIPSGSPMVPLIGHSIPGIGHHPEELRLNQFTYRKDRDGSACPLGAHIRRANPRTADLPEGTGGWWSQLIRILGFGRHHFHDDLIASTRFHRMLRRGREYILETGREGEDDSIVRGLRFICLNANISRQFEFIQTSWFANPNFEGLGETDPLIGNRDSLIASNRTATFTRPQQSGLCYRQELLPTFVHVRGGGYFFLPGISALRYLTGGEP